MIENHLQLKALAVLSCYPLDFTKEEKERFVNAPDIRERLGAIDHWRTICEFADIGKRLKCERAEQHLISTTQKIISIIRLCSIQSSN